MMYKIDMTLPQLTLIYEALEIADSWYKASKKFLNLKKIFMELIKNPPQSH